MVAIVSGNGLGLLNSSAGLLGQLGATGVASQGNSKESAFLNIYNGNLSLTDSDDFLAARGVNVALTRTYNAQGGFNTGNGANWQYGLSRQVVLESGVANAAGSSVIRTAGDGSTARYTYDSAKQAYTSTDGGGATQSITYNAASNEWTWRGDRNDQSGTREIYDGNNNGRLSSIRDLVGVRQVFQYNAAGRLSQITDATGASGIAGTAENTANDQTYFDYDGNGNLSRIRHRLAGGATFTRAYYTYDAQNRLRSASIDLTPEDNSIGDGKVYTTTYSYDGGSNRIASILQSDGSVLNLAYQQYGDVFKVSSYSDALGRTTTLDYSVPGRTSVTDPLGQTTTYSYDAQGRLTSISTPAPVSGDAALATQFYYDAAGNVSRMVDARGLETVYAYDVNGNRILERDALGNTITRLYHLTTNQLLAEARFLTPDPDGAGSGAASLPASTRYIYDASSRLHYLLSADGRITEFRYNALGEISSELHYASVYNVASLAALAVPTEAQLNTAVAAAAMDKTKLQRIDYSYDARGLRASATRFAVTNASGEGVLDGRQTVQRYVYDQAGNLLATYDGNNNPTTTTYDGLGRTLLHTDALGNSVLNTYENGATLVVRSRDAAGRTLSTVTYVRDAAGQLTSVTQSYDQQSGSASHAYDADGRLRISTSVSGQRTYWLYDHAGRKVAQIEHNGALTEFVYNADSQLTRTIRYAGLVDTERLISEYGQPLEVALAQLRPASDSNDRSSWNSYDKAGRLSASVDANGYLTRYVYDGASRLVQTTYRALAIDTSKLDGQSIADSYTGEASADDRISRNFYNLDGQLLGKLDAGGNLTEYIYNATSQLTDTILYANPTPVAQRAAGALAALRPAANAADIRQRNFYNGKGLLIATLDGDNFLTEINYDAAGNVESRVRYATAVTTPAAATVELLGKKIGVDDRATLYSYNANGQLLQETTLAGTFKKYSYDAAGNVIAVSSGAGDITDRTSLTRYDGAGRVIAQLSAEGAARLAALGADPAVASVEAVWNTYAVRYAYNIAGQRLSATDAMGNRTLYFYDQMGRQSATVGADGAVLQQRYDQDGLLLQTLQYAKHLSVAQLAALSGGADGALSGLLLQLASVSQDHRNLYYYDVSGRLAYTVNADGEVSGQSYNSYGQVVRNVRYSAGYSGAQLQGLNGGRGAAALSELAGIPNNADSNAQSLAYYDANGRLIYSVNAMGEVSGQTYNAAGLVATSSQYGARIALSSLTGASTDVAKLAALAGKVTVTNLYDHRGNAVDVSDALLNHTLSSYNAFGELAKRTQLATANSLAAAALDLSLRTLYDQAGRVLATIDSSGALMLNRYDAAGRLAEQIRYATRLAAADATAASATTVAALAARLAAVSDARVRYVYDEAGRVAATATLQRGGASEEWSVVRQRYDRNGNILERIAYATVLQRNDPSAADINAVTISSSDAITQYRYDNLNRVVATAVAQYLASDGRAAWGVSTVSYDAMGNVASRTQYANMAYGNSPLDPLNTAAYSNAAVDRTTRYSYDALNRLVYSIDAVGSVTGIVYDSLGRAAQTTHYATASQLAGAIPASFVPASAAADRVSRTIYNLLGQPVYEIEADGAVAERRYDAYGNLSSRIRYAATLSATALASLSAATTPGELKALLAPAASDRTERYYYDLNGQLRFQVDPAGYFKETRYNALGQVTHSIQYQSPKALTDASLMAVLVSEAAAQAGAAVLDQRPRVAEYTYDAQGNLYSSGDALGKSIYSYDALGHKLTMANALGKIWTYKYDAAGHHIEEISPEVTVYQDGASVAMGAWGGGTAGVLVTTLSYDALGNLSSRTEASNTAQQRTTAYQYDRVGRQTQISSPDVMVYDASAQPDLYGRTEKQAAVVVKVWYDALGNAVVNQDAGGAVTQKSYDQLGRVAFDIDALGYVTGYQRNSFGETIRLTRYNLPQTVSAWGGKAQVERELKADAANDRVVLTTYDVRGHAIKVSEPATLIYDQRATGSRYLSAARTTESTYNGLGDLIQQQVYGADADGKRVTEGSSTRYYYDARGLRTAQINALSDTPLLRSGYLSTFEYNDIGKLTRQVDYSAAVTFSDTGAAPVGVATDKLNRTVQYAYDRNANLVSETQVGVDYINAAGAAVVNGSLTTKYTYDAINRQTSVTNALNQVTNTYYDALGRTTAVSRQLTATTAQLTEFKRDLMGNAVLRIDYASAVATASGGSLTVMPAVTAAIAADLNNRVTATSFDRGGRVIRVLDAEQYATRADHKAVFSSYDVYGNMVRQWRTVTGAGVARTAYQINQYDALGRLLWTQTPGNINLLDNTTAADVRQTNQYNAFGELTGATTTDTATGKVLQSTLTRYDQAGRAWFTNANNGIDTVNLYDALGNATAQIRSAATDQSRLHELRDAANAMAATTIAQQLRTENQYDLLGRVVDTRLITDENSVLRWMNGAWVKTTPAYNEAVNDSLIVIGTPADTAKNIGVRYRLKPDGAWTSALGSRLQTINGYPVFSTGGLPPGDYEYQVVMQPAGEPQYQASSGSLHITTTTSTEKDFHVVALYMLLLGRTPAAPELNYWVNAFNQGATLTEIAGNIYIDAEARQLRAGSNANAVRKLFEVAGKPLPSDPNYASELAIWTARLDQASTATAYGEVLDTLVFVSLPAIARRANAVTNYLVRGGSDQWVVDNLLAHADTAGDAAIAEGTRAAEVEAQRRQLARLYLGLFSRAPDKAGFDFWAAALVGGVSIEAVALNMLQDREAIDPALLPATLERDAYNDKLIKLAYVNLMGRAPTAAELAEAKATLGLATPPSTAHASFLVKLGARVAGDLPGAAPVDAAARTLLFQKTAVALAYASMPSQGADTEQIIAVNKAAIAAMTTADSAASAAHQATLYLQTQAQAARAALNAIVPAAAAVPLETLRLQLARAYAVVLNRAPDRDGFVFWINQLKSNGPGAMQSIIKDMLNGEGRNAALYPPSLSDKDFITRVFTLGLGMQPESQALANAVGAWLPRAAGQERAKLMLDIINSVVMSSYTGDQSMRSLLNNKAAVGVTYAVNFAGSDLGQEKTILQLVTDSDITAAIQYGNSSALQIAAEAALASAEAAKAAASQTTLIVGAVQGVVSATTKVTAAQTAANANALSAPMLRATQLYVTLLMRGTPGRANLDLGGLSAMTQQMAAGATDVAMAQSILDSAEGRAMFPTTSYNPTQFVTQMYRQALGREPDPAGLAFWVAGAQTLASRAQIAVDMVRSFLTDPIPDSNPSKQGNQLAQAAFYDKMATALTALNADAVASVNALAAAVVSATDADTKAKAAASTATAAVTAANNVASTNARKVLEISRLFVGILNRSPSNPIDIAGLNFWTRARMENVTLESIASDFLKSAEGKLIFAGATTNAAFINQIYQQVLGRLPAPGDNFWLNQLNAGASRGAIASAIVTSLTEQTYQAESEYLAKAAFNQRVADVMKVVAGTAAADASAAAAAVASTLALKNSTAKTQADKLAALNAANALTVEADPAVIAAKAAAPRGAAFLASANVKAVTEMLLAFNRPTDFNSVYAIISGSLTGEPLLLSVIKPLVLSSLSDRPAFFRDLYTKLLKRAPDQAGLDWWVSATAGITDPAKVAYEFFKGALVELTSPIAGVSARTGFNAEFNAIYQSNQAQASSMANGYAPAQALAASQIAQKRSDAQAAYTLAISAASQADQNWQTATSYNNVAKLSVAALNGAANVQTANIAADKAAAASLAAIVNMQSVAASVGQPADTTLAQYKVLSANAVNLQKALVLLSTLETTQAALARANAARTDAVQNPVGTSTLSDQVAAVTQIYTAVLNRAPTLLELNLSLGSMKNGKTADDIAAALIVATPTVYPLTMTNDAFVTKIYSQAMGRAPDAKGLRFWSDALNGANGLTRGALVMSMIRSMTIENLNSDTVTFNNRVAGYLNTLSTQAQAAATPAKNASTLADFIAANTAAARLEATNFDAAAQAALPAAGLYETELTQLYIALLGRSPEASALSSAVAQRSTGVPLVNIALGILDSQEIRSRFAVGLSDAQFITDFYRLALGRPADAAEITAGVALLAGGKNNRGQVVISLLKDLYAYNGNDAVKVAARTVFMAKVSTSLERSVAELQLYSSQIDAAAARSVDVEKVAILTRMADGTVLGIDGANSQLSTQAAPRMTLDRWGNVLSITDPRNPNWRISYTYNYNNQQLTQTANALVGSVAPTSSTEYDALGRVARTADAVARKQGYFSNRFAYDVQGNLLLETHADGGTVDYKYNLFGERELVKRWDSATTGVQTNYAYDHLGHLISTKTAAAVTVLVAVNTGSAMDLNNYGLQQLEERFEYDELGRKVRSVDGANVSTYTEYDLAGNVIATMTQGNLYRTVHAYDAFHNRIATQDAMNHKMFWTVDSYGQVSQFRDMGNKVTNYSYDAAGRNILTNVEGHTISQTYENGLLVRIVNSESGLTTNYTYDVVGNRLTEKQSYAGNAPAQVQDNTLKYDMQNRLIEIQDGDHYTLKYSYDDNGNRISTTTAYTGVAAFTKYNAYDQMNRQIIVNADSWDATQKKAVLGKTGHQITYDKAGNRLSDSYIGVFINKDNFSVTYNTQTTETYSYDAAGRLQYSYRDGVLFDSRTYDAAGRITQAGEVTKASDASRRATYAAGILSQRRTFSYDIGGHITRQQMFNYDDPNQDIYFVWDQWNTQGGYDAMGNLTGYTVVIEGTKRGDNGTYQIEYEWSNGAREKATKLTRNNTTVSSVYDSFGNRIQVIGEKGNLQKQFWYDADGHVQSKIDDGKSSFSLIVNGQVLGEENYRDDNILGSAYQPASASSLAAAPSAYSVQSNNETLQSIAQNIWGDAKLWYLIADANGLSADASLKTGDILRIPSRINTVHNDYATFKPYVASDAIGNTAPALPPPSRGGGCGGVGQLIMVVVAVVVTIYTAGALTSGVLGFAEAMSAGMGALSGGIGLGYGAVAAATGSVASQAVGIAIGAQDGFDWRGVAMAAVGGAVSAAVPTNVMGLSGYSGAVARAAVSNASVQAVSIATGLQKGFDWRNVAASAAGGAASYATSGSNFLSEIFGDSPLVQRTIGGFAAGAATAIVRGGKIDVASIATDAFGNAMGSSLADSINSDGRILQRRGWAQTTSIEPINSYGPQVDIRELLAGLTSMSSDIEGAWPENLNANTDNASDDIWMSEVAGTRNKDASMSSSEGIMKDETVQKYIKGMKDAFKTWKTDTTASRIAHAQAVIDSVTTEAKLPSLPIISDADLDPRSKLNLENAVFDSRNWRMIVRADLLTRNTLSTADAASLAGTIFHETRHSEQEFNILRYAEPSGWRFGGIAVPASVSKLARDNPLSSNSALGIEAKTMYENIYGLGRARRAQILSELSSTTRDYNQTVQKYGAASSQAMFAKSAMMVSYDAYRAFPEESDAFNAGNKIKNQWKR